MSVSVRDGRAAPLRGVRALVANWRPSEWQQVEPPETTPAALGRGWGPGSHGPEDKGFSLQQRDVEILSRLWAAGMLLTSHVHALFFSEADIRRCRRRLERLYDVGLVRRYRPPFTRAAGTAEYQWSLSALGFNVLKWTGLPWWTARYPNARWDKRQEDRAPQPSMLHDLIVAEIACWAVSRLGREWIFVSEPSCQVAAGTTIGRDGKPKELTFRPDAILRGDAHEHTWFLEMERAAQERNWRRKVEAWVKWAESERDRERGLSARADHDRGMIVVAGYRHDSAQRWERGVLPLFRLVPGTLRPYMYFLDLERWDPQSSKDQLQPIP